MNLRSLYFEVRVSLPYPSRNEQANLLHIYLMKAQRNTRNKLSHKKGRHLRESSSWEQGGCDLTGPKVWGLE